MSETAYSHLVKLDAVTRSQAVISTDHSLIHQGRGFSADVKAAALGDSAYISISILPVSSIYIHLKRYEPWFDGDYGTFSIIEGCSVSGGASAGRGRNRVSDYSPASTVLTGATITGGAEIESFYVGGGANVGNSSVSGQRSIDIEWVLNPGTQYALKLLNGSGGAAKAALWAFWYEEDRG